MITGLNNQRRNKLRILKSFKRLFARQALKVRILFAPQVRIVVGAGSFIQPGWLSTNRDLLDILAEDDWRYYFSIRKVDAILAEHVWEHLTEEQGRQAAELCYKYLRPGGHARIAVPDGNHPDPEYIANVTVNGKGSGAHDHKVLYDYVNLKKTFESAGFKVDLLEYFDSSGRHNHKPWDPTGGMIRRSLLNDPRNINGKPVYTSIIADAVKPDM